MKNPKYVFVNDNGKVFSIANEPTSEDLLHVSLGGVNIVRMADGFYCGDEGQWLPIPAGELIAVDLEEDGIAPPAHYFPYPDPEAVVRVRPRRGQGKPFKGSGRRKKV